jgi:hypothetical protein
VRREIAQNIRRDLQLVIGNRSKLFQLLLQFDPLFQILIFVGDEAVVECPLWSRVRKEA